MESDSDSSDCSDHDVIFTPPNKVNKSSVADLLRASLPQQSNMTSLESMAAQLATIASLNGFPPIYPGKYINAKLYCIHSSSIYHYYYYYDDAVLMVYMIQLKTINAHCALCTLTISIDFLNDTWFCVFD